MIRFKYWLFDHYWQVSLGLMAWAAALAAARMAEPAVLSLALLFWLQRQYAEERKQFTKLFDKLNRRFRLLQGQVTAICAQENREALDDAQLAVLRRYFDLCSEAFLHYNSGHVPAPVWETWRSGMRIHYYNDRIRKIWDKELDHNAGYGFSRHWLQ